MDFSVNSLHAQYPMAQRKLSVENSPSFGDQAVSIFDTAKKLKQNVNRLDEAQAALYAGGVVPTVRRLGSLPRLIEGNNGEGAAIALGYAALNVPADLTHTGLAWREAKHLLKNGLTSIPKREHQWIMRSVAGTPLDFLLNKKSFKWLEQIDNTLFDTKFGRGVRDIFKIHFDKANPTIFVKPVFENSTAIPAHKIAGNYIQQIIGRALLRTSTIGLAISTAIETPALFKAAVNTEGTTMDKAKAVGIQALKSGSFIALSTAAIGIAGAILFPYGVLASLAGMAIGSFSSLEVSKGVNKLIDKAFKSESQTVA